MVKEPLVFEPLRFGCTCFSWSYNAVPLLQFWFVCVSVTPTVPLCLVIVCSSCLIIPGKAVFRECGISWVTPFIFYIENQSSESTVVAFWVYRFILCIRIPQLLTILVKYLNKYSLLLNVVSKKKNKKTGGVANSVDPDEMPHSSASHLVYTVCSGLSVWIHTVTTADHVVKSEI